MGIVRHIEPVKLFVGVLFGHAQQDMLSQARDQMVESFGPIDAEAGPWAFDQTDYYADEMGAQLDKVLWSFERMIDPGELPDVKLVSNAAERELARMVVSSEGGTQVARQVNLDPGYITLSQVVLATTKAYSHRIYVGRGMYAEVTLHYEKGRYRAWPWTYPDYADGRYDNFWLEMRDIYHRQLRGDDADSDDK